MLIEALLSSVGFTYDLNLESSLEMESIHYQSFSRFKIPK